MHRLRTARLLACLVLGWFVLVVGVAAAAPALHPQALDLVCTGAGMKLVPADLADGERPAAAGLDCPLCVAVVPPPLVGRTPAVQPAGPAAGLPPVARAVALARAALPARGPPSRFA